MIVEFRGAEYEFPDDAPREKIQAFLRAKSQADSTAQPAAAAMTPPGGAVQPAPIPATSAQLTPDVMAQAGMLKNAAMPPEQPQQQYGNAFQQAIRGPLEMVVPPALSLLGKGVGGAAGLATGAVAPAMVPLGAMAGGGVGQAGGQALVDLATGVPLNAEKLQHEALMGATFSAGEKAIKPTAGLMHKGAEKLAPTGESVFRKARDKRLGEALGRASEKTWGLVGQAQRAGHEFATKKVLASVMEEIKAMRKRASSQPEESRKELKELVKLTRDFMQKHGTTIKPIAGKEIKGDAGRRAQAALRSRDPVVSLGSKQKFNRLVNGSLKGELEAIPKFGKKIAKAEAATRKIKLQQRRLNDSDYVPGKLGIIQSGLRAAQQAVPNTMTAGALALENPYIVAALTAAPRLTRQLLKDQDESQ